MIQIYYYPIKKKKKQAEKLSICIEGDRDR